MSDRVEITISMARVGTLWHAHSRDIGVHAFGHSMTEALADFESGAREMMAYLESCTEKVNQERDRAVLSKLTHMLARPTPQDTKEG